MKASKHWTKLQFLLKKPSFTSVEAKEHGVSSRMLVYFYKEGYLERIGRGIYRSSLFEGGEECVWQDLAWASNCLTKSI